MAAEKLAYSPQEAATALGLCLNSIYKYLKTGRLKGVKLERKILIPRIEIERFIRPNDFKICNHGKEE